MNSEIINIQNEDIKSLIYTIRGKQVMLDSDVARLYKYETREINQTMRRNVKRFPINFCFQLSEKELRDLRSQIVIANQANATQISTSRRFLPYVFTEQRYCNVVTFTKK